MKRTLFGLLAIMLAFGFVGCGSGGGGKGGGGATYSVHWGMGGKPRLTLVFGDLEHSEIDKIRSAITADDIILDPADRITLGTKDTESGTGFIWFDDCVVKSSGDVKITLKSVAGFTFKKEGTDTISVTTTP